MIIIVVIFSGARPCRTKIEQRAVVLPAGAATCVTVIGLENTCVLVIDQRRRRTGFGRLAQPSRAVVGLKARRINRGHRSRLDVRVWIDVLKSKEERVRPRIASSLDLIPTVTVVRQARSHDPEDQKKSTPSLSIAANSVPSEVALARKTSDREASAREKGQLRKGGSGSGIA